MTREEVVLAFHLSAKFRTVEPDIYRIFKVPIIFKCFYNNNQLARIFFKYNIGSILFANKNKIQQRCNTDLNSEFQLFAKMLCGHNIYNVRIMDARVNDEENTLNLIVDFANNIEKSDFFFALILIEQMLQNIAQAH